jgi:hypothetical protein
MFVTITGFILTVFITTKANTKAIDKLEKKCDDKFYKTDDQLAKIADQILALTTNVSYLIGLTENKSNIHRFPVSAAKAGGKAS